jgi:hypothetical protein
MARRGILDRGMVWNTFNYFVQHYHAALGDRIHRLRIARKRPTLLTEFEWLETMLAEQQLRETTHPRSKLSDEDIRKFLEGESHLSSESTTKTSA